MELEHCIVNFMTTKKLTHTVKWDFYHIRGILQISKTNTMIDSAYELKFRFSVEHNKNAQRDFNISLGSDRLT